MKDDECWLPGYLKCSKIINGDPVVTGWAQNEAAAARHAEAVGGEVIVSSKELGIIYVHVEAVPGDDIDCHA